MQNLDQFYESSMLLKKFTPLYLWLVCLLNDSFTDVRSTTGFSGCCFAENTSRPCRLNFAYTFWNPSFLLVCVFKSALWPSHLQRTISRWWRSRGPLQDGSSVPRWRRPTGPPPCRPPGAWRHTGGHAGWPDAERQWLHRGWPAAGRCRSPLRERRVMDMRNCCVWFWSGSVVYVMCGTWHHIRLHPVFSSCGFCCWF